MATYVLKTVSEKWSKFALWMYESTLPELNVVDVCHHMRWRRCRSCTFVRDLCAFGMSKENRSDMRNRILWTPPPTPGFISGWVEKRAVVSRTLISHKHSDSEGGFVPGNPFRITKISIDHGRKWEYSNTNCMCLKMHLKILKHITKTNVLHHELFTGRGGYYWTDSIVGV